MPVPAKRWTMNLSREALGSSEAPMAAKSRSASLLGSKLGAGGRYRCTPRQQAGLRSIWPVRQSQPKKERNPARRRLSAARLLGFPLGPIRACFDVRKRFRALAYARQTRFLAHKAPQGAQVASVRAVWCGRNTLGLPGGTESASGHHLGSLQAPVWALTSDPFALLPSHTRGGKARHIPRPAGLAGPVAPEAERLG